MSKIINISEAISIAFHSMIIIARSENRKSVTDLAEMMSSSRHHIAKVMQRLTKGKLISSSRGPKGGFVISKKPENISLLNIYEIIEGEVELSTCPMDYHECKFNNCLFSDLTNKVSSEFLKYLKDHTIADFI